MSKHFKPIMISFAENEYKAKQDLAKSKLERLDEGSVWIANTIDAKKCDMKKLSNNMVGYFKRLILETFMEQNTLGLSADKLIEAKEIDISVLRTIQKEYEKINADITFNNNVPSIKIERREYETWTTSESQNKRLLAGSKLISNLKDVEKYAQVYPRDINKATSGFINYNLQKQTYFVSPEFVFSDYKRTVV